MRYFAGRSDVVAVTASGYFAGHSDAVAVTAVLEPVGRRGAIEKMLNLIGFVVAKSERNSELGMHEQTDLVAL